MRALTIELDKNYQTKKGKVEAFGSIKNHLDVEGIIRYALMGKEDFDDKGFHIAVHTVSEEYYQNATDFSTPHKHDFDEINIIVPLSSSLVYAFEVDGEEMTLEAPHTLFIPAGAYHQAKPLSGEGIFICIQLDNKANDRPRQEDAGFSLNHL